MRGAPFLDKIYGPAFANFWQLGKVKSGLRNDGISPANEEGSGRSMLQEQRGSLQSPETWLMAIISLITTLKQY
jgi:hypothetical protein